MIGFQLFYRVFASGRFNAGDNRLFAACGLMPGGSSRQLLVFHQFKIWYNSTVCIHYARNELNHCTVEQIMMGVKKCRVKSIIDTEDALLIAKEYGRIRKFYYVVNSFVNIRFDFFSLSLHLPMIFDIFFRELNTVTDTPTSTSQTVTASENHSLALLMSCCNFSINDI